MRSDRNTPGYFFRDTPDGNSRMVFTWRGKTFTNELDMLQAQWKRRRTFTSLTIATVIGSPVALGLSEYLFSSHELPVEIAKFGFSALLGGLAVIVNRARKNSEIRSPLNIGSDRFKKYRVFRKRGSPLEVYKEEQRRIEWGNREGYSKESFQRYRRQKRRGKKI